MPRRAIRLEPLGAKDALDLKPGIATVEIRQVRLRAEQNTRPLNAAHVVSLAQSIAILGLLEPIVLDTRGNLLAGGHRLAALQLLAEAAPIARRRQFLERCGHKPKDPAESLPGAELLNLADALALLGTRPLARYPNGEIQVQVVDVTGRGGTDLALAVEAAENNIRRQYTNDEIEALAERFRAAGYKTTAGKPKAGEKTMLGALEAAVGRSKRQIQRILDGGSGSGKSEWDKAVAALRRAAARVIKAGGRKQTDEAKAVVALADRVGKALPG
jgi:ParB family chromosome partitioning protein